MFLLNLGIGEFLALFGAVSGIVVALYLLDRSRRKLTVATLRFWTPSEQPPEKRTRRRRIQQPLSLILQLLSLLCLLLAIAQLRLGTRDSAGRDHVLILDTSAWMDARSGQGTLMDEARRLALAWVRALPAGDRVMLIRADGLATPATVFESSRAAVEEAIARSHPGSTALNLDAAFELARQVRHMHSSSAGEVVFAGAGRVTEQQSGAEDRTPPNLRVLPVAAAVENCGLRTIGLRRSHTVADVWEVFVTVRNYGQSSRVVRLALQFGGAPAGLRRIDLPPGTEQNATFELHTRSAGWVEARILGSDDFAADDYAVLELPRQPLVRVAVYSESPAWLRPVLSATPNVEAQFFSPSEYVSNRDADLVILDRFRPPALPSVGSIWIEPPAGASPVRVKTSLRNARVTQWLSGHPLGAGLRVQDLRLESATVFDAAPGDIPIAETEAGPVILARAGKPRIVVLGFHPLRSSMRYELAAPLLFANLLHWMSPEIFRRWELNAGSVGSVTAVLESEADASQARVLTEDQIALPFTVQGRNVRFFAGTPGTVRVLAGDRELVYSLTLPEVAVASWQPPGSVRRGVPSPSSRGTLSRDLWQILAILGGLGLLVDWLWFGRGVTMLRGATRASIPSVTLIRLRDLFGGLARKAS